jgi:spore coat protein U-like protein
MSARAFRVRWMLLGLLIAAPSAQAVISCNATVSSISVFYNPAGPSDVVTSGTYNVFCSRAGGDPTSVSFSLESDNGLYPQGTSRRVQYSGSYYDYALFKDLSLAPNQQWGTAAPNSRQISGSVNFIGGALSGSTSGPFYVQIKTGQAVGPAGVYTDTVGTTLTYGATSTISVGAFNVNVTSITSCALAVPTALTFNYTSFQATAATPSANFTVNCTTGTPYTIVLDNTGPITDDAVNLTYTLGLSATAGTGSGTNQTYQVLGNMAAGQSGTCAASPCTNAAATNRTRSITVNY